MRKLLMLSTLFALVTVLSAADTQLDPNSVIINSNASRQIEQEAPDMRVAVPVGVENNPFYYSLELLTQQERENAGIEIMFMAEVSQEIKDYARSVEQTWNSGAFNQALDMFEQLNSMPGVQGNAVIGIMWKTPIPAPVSEWGTDVQISARDSVFVLAMDRDNATNNLFAMIGFTGDGMGSKYTANFSSDGGVTWVETYTLGGFGYVMNDLDACASGNYFWVAYTGGLETNSMCWLKRFQASDGAAVNMPNGSSTYNLFTTTLPDTIMDLEITSNHDQFNNRLYAMAIIKNGTIRAFWGYTDQVNWTEYTIAITDALQGLDANWNYGYSNYFLLMSYINNADEVVLYGKATDWAEIYSSGINDTYWYFTTSCGGWQDTLFFTFNYVGAHVQARYLVQYGSASPWYYGFLAPDTLVNNFTPDVTLRNAGGTHGCYRGPGTADAFYRSRGYSGAWTTPVDYGDQPASAEVRPEIENVDGVNYGILYRTPLAVYSTCYFDRSDWVTGVAEYKVDGPVSAYISLAPNPARNLSVLSFVTSQEGRVAITLYDAVGRSVENIIDRPMSAGNHSVNLDVQNLAAGIYFVHVETPDGVGSKTMTIVK